MDKNQKEMLIAAVFIGLFVAAVNFPQIFVVGFGDNSDGVRIGTIVKLSERGWLWKTWEGEMAMGSLKGATQSLTSYILEFSVCDGDSRKIEAIQNNIGNEVLIRYHSPPLWFRWNQGSKYCVKEVTQR